MWDTFPPHRVCSRQMEEQDFITQLKCQCAVVCFCILHPEMMKGNLIIYWFISVDSSHHLSGRSEKLKSGKSELRYCCNLQNLSATCCLWMYQWIKLAKVWCVDGAFQPYYTYALRHTHAHTQLHTLTHTHKLYFYIHSRNPTWNLLYLKLYYQNEFLESY